MRYLKINYSYEEGEEEFISPSPIFLFPNTMKTRLLKKLRKEAEKHVYLTSEPHSWYYRMNSPIPIEYNRIIKDAPKEYLNDFLTRAKEDYIVYRIRKIRNKKSKIITGV